MDLGERLDPVPACYPAHEPKRRIRRGRGKIAASTSIQTEGNRTPKKDADWSENVKKCAAIPICRLRRGLSIFMQQYYFFGCEFELLRAQPCWFLIAPEQVISLPLGQCAFFCLF